MIVIAHALWTIIKARDYDWTCPRLVLENILACPTAKWLRPFLYWVGQRVEQAQGLPGTVYMGLLPTIQGQGLHWIAYYGLITRHSRSWPTWSFLLWAYYPPFKVKAYIELLIMGLLPAIQGQGLHGTVYCGLITHHSRSRPTWNSLLWAYYPPFKVKALHGTVYYGLITRHSIRTCHTGGCCASIPLVLCAIVWL